MEILRSPWTETVAIPAGHTAPEHPDVGDSDRYGLVHVIPGNKADSFVEAFARGDFPRYDVYRAESTTRLFLVTELLDPGTETALYVAGSVRLADLGGLVRTVRAENAMYTHVQTLDGTHLGSFEHDGYEKFFPRTDRYADPDGPNRE